MPPDLAAAGLQDRDDPLVHVFEQAAPSVEHLLADLLLQLGLEGIERRIDLGLGARILDDFQDALLDVNAALDRAEYFVAGAEDALEQPKFLAQQLVDP